MQNHFTSLEQQVPRPFSLSAIQLLKTNDLFRSLGDESTSNSISIRLNPRSEQDDNDKPCAVVLPGIQGVATEEWHTFGANLSTPAYLIPFMKAKDATTFEGVAESIITVVSDCFARQKQFYIVGFSFGAIVALKLAQMLECSGKRGRILLIDGSPIYMKKMFTSMMSPTAQKDRNVEDILIMLLYFNMCSKNTTYDFIDQLPNWDSWPKKMDLLFRYVPDTIKQTYSTQYMRNVCTAMLKRVLAIVKTSTDIGPDAVKLKSLATLVRPTQTPFSDIADDFDLSKYFEKTVDIRFVKGTNAKMLNNDEVIQIVDKFAPAE